MSRGTTSALTPARSARRCRSVPRRARGRSSRPDLVDDLPVRAPPARVHRRPSAAATSPSEVGYERARDQSSPAFLTRRKARRWARRAGRPRRVLGRALAAVRGLGSAGRAQARSRALHGSTRTVPAGPCAPTAAVPRRSGPRPCAPSDASCEAAADVLAANLRSVERFRRRATRVRLVARRGRLSRGARQPSCANATRCSPPSSALAGRDATRSRRDRPVVRRARSRGSRMRARRRRLHPEPAVVALRRRAVVWYIAEVHREPGTARSTSQRDRSPEGRRPLQARGRVLALRRHGRRRHGRRQAGPAGHQLHDPRLPRASRSIRSSNRRRSKPSRSTASACRRSA